MDFSLIAILVFFVLILIFIVCEFSRTQRDADFEIQWIRRSIALLGAGVMVLAVSSIVWNYRYDYLMARIQSSEEAIAGLQAMRQSQ